MLSSVPELRLYSPQNKVAAGFKRITAELKDQAGHEPANHKRVARVMRSLKLFGYTKKRKVTTTVSGQKKPVFPDLVGRRFTAPAPNRVYVGDITYLPIADGSNMYLATVIDCFPVGWWVSRSRITCARP